MNWKIFLFAVVILLSSCKKKKDSASDDKDWKKYGDAPVVKRGPAFVSDFYAISDCWVLNDQGIYKMWYTGGGAVAPDTILHSSIHYAWSLDGLHWNKQASNPVLDISKTGWDSLGVETATVLIDKDAPSNERYKMWYAGQTYNDYRYEIGYAYSPDGKVWTKHPSPVVQVGGNSDWDNAFLEGPSVIKEGAIYKMWYCGLDLTGDGQITDFKASIGYATSTDGITWVKHAGPVLTTTAGSWDAVYVQDPHVIKYNNLYHMWYGGTNVYDDFFQQTGYAYSVDGIHWVKSLNNPVLPRGAAGSWDANTASFPSVLIEQGTMKMWYTGKDVEPLPTWPLPYYWDIGYAEKELPYSIVLD